MKNCLIIGAGMAGLMAAQRLQDAGIAVTLLDKGRGVGGRMATRRFDGATADHGAQFFTVRSERFGRWVNEWLAAGAAVEWCRGFGTQDGHPRYRGSTGMTAVPKHLAENLEVRLKMTVDKVDITNEKWQVAAEGETFTAEALILTPPVPQALTILEAGGVELPTAAQRSLEQIKYDPCFAVLATLAGESGIPEPGGVQQPGEPIQWIGDNRQKGISPQTAVTIHATADFTRRFFEATHKEVADLLLAAAEAMGFLHQSQIQAVQVQRWRYAQPSALHPARTLAVLDGSVPPVAFAGDAFHEARVEGASLSGLAAAEALLEKF